MKIVRILLVLLVLAYAGWLAWPFVAPFLEAAPADVAAERAGAVAEAGGGIPQAALWIAAVVLYLVAAIMLGSGNPRAAVAYFLGFIADAALRLALDGSGGSQNASIQAETYAGGGELARRSAEAAAPMGGLGVDPTWLILGALLVIGVLVLVVSRRRRRHRIPGQLTA
jgi:hypothetical protein